MHLREKYSPRPIRCLEVWSHAGWRVKVYSISYQREVARPEMVARAKELARQYLPHPAVTESRYGAGYMGIHDGRGFVVIFLDWWENENELFHRVFLNAGGDSLDFRRAGPDELISCAWDTRVHAHERDAWVAAVLANPAGPSLDAYFAHQFNGDV